MKSAALLSGLIVCLLSNSNIAVWAAPEPQGAAAEAAPAPPGIPRARLHRVDFRIEGTSCAVCLLQVERAFAKASGVLKAGVSIQPPYRGVVIYDSRKTGFSQLLENVRKAEPDVRVVEVEDEPIAEMPLVLIPKSGKTAPSGS